MMQSCFIHVKANFCSSTRFRKTIMTIKFILVSFLMINKDADFRDFYLFQKENGTNIIKKLFNRHMKE